MEILIDVISNFLLFLFIILVASTILLMFQFQRVKIKLRKYSDIKERILSRFKNLRGSKFIRHIIWDRLSLGIYYFRGFYSISGFNRHFNKIYYYKDILNTRDKSLIRLVNNYRLITFIFYISFMVYALIIIGIAIITIILFIIAMIMNGGGFS